MKLPSKSVVDLDISVENAHQQLIDAVTRLVKRTGWSNPYAAFDIKQRAKINELRIPLVQLKLAKKKANKI